MLLRKNGPELGSVSVNWLDGKLDAASPGAAEREDPADGLSGQEPMTTEQASRLKILSRQAADPDAYDETLTQAEALQRIVALNARLERERNGGVDRLPRT